ncbi:MAG: ferric iron uptake transcriptional regulator [Pseudomonadota bacterium]
MKDEELKKAGLKITTPRLKILQLLEAEEKHHLSAEDIFKRLSAAGDDIALATVYRVLTQFEAAGLVIRHNFEGGHSIFELDQGEHHDHLVCTKCGQVIEFVDSLIESQQKKIAEEKGFLLTDHSLTIYGMCENCRDSHN